MPLANHRMRSPAWVIVPALGIVICSGLLLGAGKTVLKGVYLRQLHYSPNVYSLYPSHICLHAIPSIPSERVCLPNDFLTILPEILVPTGSEQSASHFNSYPSITNAYTGIILLSAITQVVTTILIVPLRIQHMLKQRPMVLRVFFAITYLIAFIITNVQMGLAYLLSVYKIEIPRVNDLPVSPAFIILNALTMVLCYSQVYPALLYAVDREPSSEIPTAARNDCDPGIFVTTTRLSSVTTIACDTDIEKSKQVFVSTNSISSDSIISSDGSLPQERHFAPSLATEYAPTLTSSSTLPSTI